MILTVYVEVDCTLLSSELVPDADIWHVVTDMHQMVDDRDSLRIGITCSLYYAQ